MHFYIGFLPAFLEMWARDYVIASYTEAEGV